MNAIEYTMIQLMKCGSVVIVWESLRKRALPISFSSTAIKSGKISAQNDIPENTNVFTRTRMVSLLVKNIWKYLSPTYVFLNSGVPGLYSNSDSTQPNNGM